MPLQKAPQIPVLSPPLETSRRRKGARVGGVKDRVSLFPQSPRGQVGRIALPGEAATQSPRKVPQADLRRTGFRARGRVELHETAARPAGDKPKWGRWNKEDQGKEARPREEGETEPGKGVIREGVKENAII